MIDSLPEPGFSQAQQITGRGSIADLFRPGQRCGLYILHFANGDIYAGQSLEVVRRYSDHRKVHSDLTAIQFRRLHQSTLDTEERALIRRLEESGYRLRNITFTSLPKGESDFDLLMDAQEQEKWLTDPGYSPHDGSRIENESLCHKYEAKFTRFMGMPYARDAIDLLAIYAAQCIPIPIQSELAFWGCSCLPEFRGPGVTIYSRININWQEVFTVSTRHNDLRISIHLAKTPLQVAFGRSLRRLCNAYPGLTISYHQYVPGGQDQINLVMSGVRGANDLLSNKEVMFAARLFNQRLMKKGPCIYGRYHCMGLADQILNGLS
jgi:hypothetical protein